MASILQDLGILEAVAGDIAAFAAGQPVAQVIDGYGVSVQVLPNGAVPPFTVISGGFFQILLAALGLAGEFAAGTPISLAIKENKTWYGITLTPKLAVGPTTAA
jgi:hypothetical protein